MEILADLAKIIIPAAIVLYGMYLTVKSFTTKELERSMVDLKMKNRDIILPIRLQAYERITLFLERISPNNLVMRLNDASFNAKQFQHILISEIRNEYNHNLSQQVYMSNEAWRHIKTTVEELISIINESVAELAEDARGIDLAKRLFEKIEERQFDQIDDTLAKVKSEIQRFF